MTLKKIILTVLMTFTFIGTIRADLGAPTIQAICKVTLKDGKIVEGIISFGSGGYEYNYRPHGFCFVHDNGTKQLILYNFSFQKFTPENYGAFRDGSAKLYYAQNVTSHGNLQPTFEFNEKERTLIKTSLDKDEYKLLDEMIMYKKLPLSLYVGLSRNNEDEKIKVKISEIKSVEILEEPGKGWLDVIEIARKKRELDKDAWEDYMEPVWYHEIITDKEKVNYLNQFF